MLEPITSFTGRYNFLSNFFPVTIYRAGVHYPTAEHAFQAAKCQHKADSLVIALALTPGEAKRIGRKVELRQDWEAIKIKVMRNILRDKFLDNPLRSLLDATHPRELIEGNDWGDNFWGACRPHPAGAWSGQNHLGKLLMEVRLENRVDLEKGNTGYDTGKD